MLLGFDGNGYATATKAAPAADGELHRWLQVCLVCVELNPSAANAPLPRGIAPKLLLSSDRVAPTPPS